MDDLARRTERLAQQQHEFEDKLKRAFPNGPDASNPRTQPGQTQPQAEALAAEKDRIGAEILTHYPKEIDLGVQITRQEAWTDRDGKERYSLEIRGESFSFTNTPHFVLNSNGNNASGNTNVSITSPTFGYVTSTLNGDTGARVFQLGMKFSF